MVYRKNYVLSKKAGKHITQIGNIVCGRNTTYKI